MICVAAVALASDISDIERDARAIELYLIDKKAHKEDCPKIKWAQPKVEVYKKDLRSHLPAGCKK